MHFFKWAGDDFMSHVKAIAMDMNTNYSQAVKDLYPSISIVYDTFHIIKWYNDQVVDSLMRSATDGPTMPSPRPRYSARTRSSRMP